MEKFQTQWKRFLESKKTLLSEEELKEIEQHILGEISSNNYEIIKNWMADADNDSDYSFKHMFDGKWRTAVPMATYADEEIVKIVDFFEDANYTVDFSTGKAAKTIETQKGRQKREVKIGKLLNKAVQLQKSFEKTRLALAFPEGSDTRPAPPRLPYPLPAPLNKIATTWEKLFSYNHHEYLTYYNPPLPKLENMLKFWNAKSEYYRTNPDKIKSSGRFAIIFSRHPVDVVRMSDFENIHSCHSEGSDYFNCAMAEAKGHGPIAYVVAAKDLEDVDLQDDEIFKDANRGIGGIEPVSRVRLRRFYNDVQGYDLAIPEESTYGLNIPGFVEAVSEWALEAQREYLEQNDPAIAFGEDEKGNLKVEEFPEMNDFVRRGGEYSDTYSAGLFNAFFNTTHYSGDVLVEPETAEVGNLFEEFEEERERIQGRANNELKHVGVWSETAETEEGWHNNEEAHLSFGGSLQVIFKSSEFVTHPLPSTWTARRPLYIETQDSLTDAGFNWDEVHFENAHGGVEGIIAEVTLAANYYEGTPEGFEDFVDSEAAEFDRGYAKIKEIIRQAMIEEGYIESSPVDKVVSELEEEEIKFKHFTWNFDGGMLEIYNELPDKKFKIKTFPTRHSPEYEMFTRLFEYRSDKNDYTLRAFEAKFLLFLKKREAEAKEFAKRQLMIPGVEPPKEKRDVFSKMISPVFFEVSLKPESSWRSDLVELYLGTNFAIQAKHHEEDLEALVWMVKFLDENMDFVVDSARTVFDEMLETSVKRKREEILNLRASAKNIAEDAIEQYPNNERIISLAKEVLIIILNADNEGRSVNKGALTNAITTLRNAIAQHPEIPSSKVDEVLKSIMLKTTKTAKTILEKKNKC
tara:strand:- start:11707 stop:14286 length:2580 start_codon:yes stop_codon:yes gene_type:complete